MDEIIIAGTGSEITPVIQVDDKIIGNGARWRSYPINCSKNFLKKYNLKFL